MTIGINWKPIWKPVWKTVWQQAAPTPPRHHATDSGRPLRRTPPNEDEEVIAIASMFT